MKFDSFCFIVYSIDVKLTNYPNCITSYNGRIDQDLYTRILRVKTQTLFQVFQSIITHSDDERRREANSGLEKKATKGVYRAVNAK